MENFHLQQAQTKMDSYTDLSSLNAIRQLGKEDKNQALEKIAKQFESMMVQMMIKSMRSANKVFSEGNIFNSNAGDTYQQMYDDQLSLTLSEGRGMGIADVMVRQLQGNFGSNAVVNNEEDPNYSLEKYSRSIKSIDRSMIDNVREKLGVGLTNIVDKVEKELVEFSGDVKSFVEKLYPMAKAAAEKIGVSPEVLMAQSALETGWGKSLTVDKSGNNSLNFFNIKADKRWSGDRVSVATLEVRNGIPEREIASFRSYKTIQESFDDYVQFITNSPRYEKSLTVEGDASYIHELAQAGYATDPDYAKKVLSVLNSDSMKKAMSDINAQSLSTDG